MVQCGQMGRIKIFSKYWFRWVNKLDIVMYPIFVALDDIGSLPIRSHVDGWSSEYMLDAVVPINVSHNLERKNSGTHL